MPLGGSCKTGAHRIKVLSEKWPVPPLWASGEQDGTIRHRVKKKDLIIIDTGMAPKLIIH